jgi:hypothetical protein
MGRVLDEDIPPVLDYLERQLPRAGFLFGSLGIADLSIAVFFRNAAFAHYSVDPRRWPVSAAFVDRVLAQECLARLRPYEALMLRTPIAEHREALAAAGAPVTAETVGGDVLRKGVMRVP